MLLPPGGISHHPALIKRVLETTGATASPTACLGTQRKEYALSNHPQEMKMIQRHLLSDIIKNLVQPENCLRAA